jgi:predicted metal-dependent HD superfamily phosphohydrolase
METSTVHRTSQDLWKDVYGHILSEQKKRLPKYLSYHNTSHIRDVIAACNRYVNIYNLTTKDEELLLLAAAGHDFGFIVSPDNHEKTGADLIAELLSFHRYTLSDINLIRGLIMATRIPQTPQTFLEKIIADADLDYLGRNDYPEISHCLYRELQYFNKIESKSAWLKLQIRFLENHSYHTDWAKENREPQKLERLQLLKSKAKVAA